VAVVVVVVVVVYLFCPKLLSRAIIAAVSYDRSVLEAHIKVGMNPMPSIVLEASTAWVRPIGRVKVEVKEKERMFLVSS
jgi:hypothetical protein